MVLVKKCPYLLDASLRKCLVSSYIVLWFGVKTSKCYVCYTNKSTAHESVKSLVYTMLAPWFYLSSTVLFSPFFSSLLHRRQFAAHMRRGKISLVQAQFSCYSLSECHKCDWKWLEIWCNDTSTSHWFTVGVRRNNKTGLVEALSDCSGKRLGTKGIFWISVQTSKGVWGHARPRKIFKIWCF